MLSFTTDATKKSGTRWAGDVDYKSAAEVASMISPVPGGVGPMTVAMLLKNTFLSAKRFWERTNCGLSISTLRLQPKQPVPR